jgi:hypothetical protein
MRARSSNWIEQGTPKAAGEPPSRCRNVSKQPTRCYPVTLFSKRHLSICAARSRREMGNSKPYGNRMATAPARSPYRPDPAILRTDTVKSGLPSVTA